MKRRFDICLADTTWTVSTMIQRPDHVEMEERSAHRISFIIGPLTQDLEFCPSRSFFGMRFALAYPEEGHHMHDPALWTNWYVALLLFPFMIIILLLRDLLAGRGRRR